MAQIIEFMRNRESAFWKKGMFFDSEFSEFCENFSRKWKLRFSLLCDVYNYNVDAYVCNVQVERIVLFRKSWISILKEKNVFRRHQFRSFDAGSVRIKGINTLYLLVCANQGHKYFVLVSSSFKAHCKLHRLAFTWLQAMMDIRVSG